VELIRGADEVSAMRFVGNTSLPLNLLWGYAATSRVHVASPTRNQIRNVRLIEENASLKKGLEFLLGRYFSPGDCSSCPLSCPLVEQ